MCMAGVCKLYAAVSLGKLITHDYLHQAHVFRLPASPLWLAGLYAPQFARLNAVMPPPAWFAVCIFSMEVCSIGFPIVGVLKGNKLREETLEAIANWETRQAVTLEGGDTSFKSLRAYSSTTTLKTDSDTIITGKSSFESQKSAMLTMTSLENALRTNPMPLLTFAALKDFSGENISFLTHVADWRRYWFSPKASTAQHRRTQFVTAAHIYAQFISLEFSEFPINISSREMKRLHNVFEDAAVLLNRGKRASAASSGSDSVTPFDAALPDEIPESPVDYELSSELRSAVNLDTLGRANLRAVSRMQDVRADDILANYAIPEAFNEMILDPAEREIKYLVLTNTWPKFVNMGYANSQMSKDVDEEKDAGWFKQVLCF